MKNFRKKLNQLIILGVALLLIGTISCTSDDAEPQGAGEFALITSSTNADGSSRAFFLQRASVDITEDIDNSNATELDPGTAAMVHAFNGAIYFSDYSNGKIDRWSISETNSSALEGEMNVSELGFQGNTAFRNAEQAFVGGVSTDLIIFNPTTMQKTGKIDISSVSNIGKSTDFPAPGGTVAVEGVTEIIIRDNFLYAALMPLADLATFEPADSKCTIIIIDLDKVDVASQDNSSAIVKRIADDRGSPTGAWGSGGGNSFMQIDENNDLYVLCHNQWAGLRAVFNKPACILKIASGTTEFDTNYYFDVETVAEGNGNPVMNFEYYGNGKFLAAVQDPSAIDPDNSFSYFLDPVYRWWSFDLYNKTATNISRNYTRGAVAAVSYFENGFGYVPFQDTGINYVLKVNLSTLESSKQFGTSGLPALYSLK